MRRILYFSAALLSMCGWGSTVWAASFAAAFLELGMGARGPGMGGAFVAVADDASAPYWNPAGLVRTQGKEVLLSLAPLSLDRRQNSISATLNARGELAFGFSWLHAGVGAIEGRTGSGVRTGKIENAENAFFVAAGRALGSRLALGFAMKVLDQRLEAPGWQQASATGHGFDLGLQIQLTPNAFVAAVARNLSASLDWKVQRRAQQATNIRNELPRLLVFGLAYRPLPVLLLAADLYRGDDAHVNLGGEWAVNPLLTLRGGVHRLAGDDPRLGSPTAGLTLRPMRRETLQFHYSYSVDPLGAGDRNVFGVSFDF